MNKERLNLKELILLMRKNKIKISIKETWTGGERGVPETTLVFENKDESIKIPKSLIN